MTNAQQTCSSASGREATLVGKSCTVLYRSPSAGAQTLTLGTCVEPAGEEGSFMASASGLPRTEVLLEIPYQTARRDMKGDGCSCYECFLFFPGCHLAA